MTFSSIKTLYSIGAGALWLSASTCLAYWWEVSKGISSVEQAHSVGVSERLQLRPPRNPV